MGQALIGGLSYVCMAAETTWGTPNTTYANFMRVVSMDPNEIIERRERTHLQKYGNTSFVAEESFEATQRIRPSLSVLMSYDDSSLFLLAHALHLDAVTTGAGPYTHTFNIGKPYDHGGTGSITGLTLGMAMGDNAEQEDIEGCKCASGSLSIEAGGEMMLSTEWIGQQSATRTTLTSPTFSSNGQGIRHSHCNQDLLFNSLTFDCVRSVEISWDNRIAERDCLGSLNTAEPMPSGPQQVSMSVTLDAPQSASLKGQLKDAYRAGTQDDVVLTFTGSGNNTASFTVHNCKIFSYSEAVNSMGVTEITVEFRAHAVTTTGLAIVITNDNATATAN